MEIKDEKRLKEIGDRLKKLRMEAGYTSYEKFATEHGMPRKQYWRHEKGFNLTVLSLFRILDIHGISIEEFFRSWPEQKN